MSAVMASCPLGSFTLLAIYLCCLLYPTAIPGLLQVQFLPGGATCWTLEK